jgi:hypothetical protein
MPRVSQRQQLRNAIREAQNNLILARYHHLMGLVLDDMLSDADSDSDSDSAMDFQIPSSDPSSDPISDESMTDSLSSDDDDEILAGNLFENI